MLNLLSRLVDNDDPARLRSAMKWLYGFVRPHGWAIAGLLALSACASLLVLAQPWITKEMIDRGLWARDYPALLVLAGAMVVAGVLGMALAGINRYLYTRLSGRILFALRSAVYAHLQKLPPSFYGARRTGDLLSRLDGDVAEIQRFALDALFSAVSNAIGLVGAFALLLSLSVKLCVLAVILLPLEALWLRRTRRKVEKAARELRESAADLSSFLVETLPAMKFIQASGQQQAERARLDHLGEHYMGRLLRLQITEFFTQSMPGLMTSFARTGVFLVGGYWVVKGHWQLGALIAFTSYLGMAVAPLKSLLGLYVALQRTSVSLLRVVELQHAGVAVEETKTPVPFPADSTLVFDDVWFGHAGATPGPRPGHARDTLRGVTAHIPAGSKVALSGPSGAGKSTLIDLMQRFYDPRRGALRVGGIDLRALDLRELRQRIAVVSQDIVLFRGSLADNVRYSTPEASRAQIEAALAAAQLDELVASLPRGIDDTIGERGQQLSGGQKQRLAIARALLQAPAILVLDEATSAVDEATEREIIAQIDRLFHGRTRILISHRASTLAHADLHFVLDDGQLRARETRACAQAGEYLAENPARAGETRASQAGMPDAQADVCATPETVLHAGNFSTDNPLSVSSPIPSPAPLPIPRLTPLSIPPSIPLPTPRSIPPSVPPSIPPSISLPMRESGYFPGEKPLSRASRQALPQTGNPPGDAQTTLTAPWTKSPPAAGARPHPGQGLETARKTGPDTARKNSRESTGTEALSHAG